MVEFTGTVELSREGGAWTAVTRGGKLSVGDHLRTGADSRATLRLSDLSLVRLRENTLVELRAPSGAGARRNLFLRSGAAYFLNRERPMDIEFGTPLASGAIRGTEFLLEASGPEGATLLALFDGAVDVQAADQALSLTRGQQVEIASGRPPVVSPAIEARLRIQWVFYYPAVLVPEDLAWADSDRRRFENSLLAYAAGDLLSARAALPLVGGEESAAAQVYRAALELAVGRVAEAGQRLAAVASAAPGREAVAELIAVVTGAGASTGVLPLPVRASDWLARSYREQARYEVSAARDAARTATRLAPKSGYAWARLAELEFAMGNWNGARTALAQARALSPQLATAHSLEGYLALAAWETESALNWFDQAIARDGAFGPAWLGRGLAHAQRREFALAREEMQVAAVLEPQRSLFRSYLAKAFSQTGQDLPADKDFRMAKELDPADPTAWFYSALHDSQLNRNNEAVRELERAVALNDNHAVFRSRFLLDQDLAMRSADLAVVYGVAGLDEVGRRAAQNAVAEDYANFSAHLFESRSLAAQEDPEQYNLRLETARESEWLLANLLAPPGGGNLSRWVSQQSRLAYLSPRRLGVTSFSGAGSDGDLEQDLALYGREAGLSYALDAQARRMVVQQPNGQLEDYGGSLQLQQRLTPADSLYFSAGGSRSERGDVAPHYDPNDANRDLRVVETQEPHAFAGYHHEWSPESHTLALVSFLRDDLQLDHSRPGMFFIRESQGEIVSIATDPFVELNLDSRFSLGSAELQQIWSTDRHQVVVGARFQGGQVDSDTTLTRGLAGTLDSENVEGTMQRATGYGYYQWDPLDWLRLNAGLSYDALRYPLSTDLPPLSGDEVSESKWSPKGAVTIFPWKGGQLRGGYSQSLGGLYFDNSVRLEPAQIGGWTQAYRSLAPESVVGLVPGTSFETVGFSFDQALRCGTYFGVLVEQLSSDGQRQVGAFTNGSPLPVPDTLVALDESLDFRERTVSAYANQLLGTSWTLGIRGSVSRAELQTRYPGLPPEAPGMDLLNSDQQATLSRIQWSARYQHPRGWFAEGYCTYYHQTNDGYQPALPGDAFWQQDVFVGFRWPRQLAEIRAGILNLSNQDYRLNPLNLLNEPQRSRTFVVSLQFNL
ncbi:MAG: hypothetical protein RIS76_2943 [Verrucomicrobiota bacterium]